MVFAYLFSSCRDCMQEFTWEKLVAMKPHSCSSSSDLALELPKIDSKLHLAVVQGVVWLLLEGRNKVVETRSQGLDPLNVRLLQH